VARRQCSKEYPSGGASVLSITVASSSNALFEVPEWEAILIDEGVTEMALMPRHPFAGGCPPLSHIADLSFRLYHISRFQHRTRESLLPK
jgi:hypothetical protein